MKIFTKAKNLKLLTLCLLGMLLAGSAWAQPKYAYWTAFTVGTEAIFSDLSHAPAPLTESSRTWDFGDGNSSVDEHPAHIYASNGLYLVILTVNWSNGSTSTYSNTLTLTDTSSAYHEEHAVQKNSTNNLFDVLANDGLDPATHTVTIATQPPFGIATMSGNNLSYTPNNNYTGWDVLSYMVCSTGTSLCDTGLVYIEVVDGACGYYMSLK